MVAAVRLAEKNDIPAIIKMGEKFYEESNFEKGGYDAQRFDEIVNFMMWDGEHFILIAHVDEKPIGFLIFDVSRHYTRYLVSCMFLFYVDADHRKHNAGMALLSAAREIAKEEGSKYFYVSSSAGFEDGGRNERALISLYKRMGAIENGVFMRVEL